METFLYYIRDNLVGTHYFIYAFILFFLMFAIIGYLFKQKYAKYQIKLNTSEELAKAEIKQKAEKNKKEKTKVVNKPVVNNVQPVVSQSNISKPETTIPKPMPNPTTKEVVTPSPMPTPATPPANPTPISQPANNNQPIPEIKI